MIRMPGIYILLLVAVLISLLTGCSGSGNLFAPDPDLISPQLYSSETQFGNNHILWGMWEIAVDHATQTAEAIPLRGAMFNANVVRFLQPPSAPIHLLTVIVNPNSNFTTGYLDLDITLKHPFVGLNKFRGFDVRGIVMGEGSIPLNFDSSIFRAGPSNLMLQNPDGWTRWWNPTEFTTYGKIFGYTQGAKAPSGYHASATLNAYKYFSDSLKKDSPLSDLHLSSRGTFGVNPGINTRNYILQFPQKPGGVDFRFNYAVDASWALPDNAYLPDYPVEAYPPEANTQEAWRIVLNDNGTTAWYVNDEAHGGSVTLNIEIFDWQGAWQQSGVADEVTSIWLDCPLFNGPVDFYPTATVNPGGLASSVWTSEISDLNLTSPGTFGCWIGVQADNPENYAPQIDGNPDVWDWPDAPLMAYGFGTIEVSPDFPGGPPEIYQVIPNSGEQSTVVTDLQILGANFQDGLLLDFKYDDTTSLQLSGIQVKNDGLITLDVSCDGPLGLYDVWIKNPDTQETTLNDCFEVTKQPEGQIWWQSHMYNAQNIGRNPMVPGADPETLELKWMTPVGGDKKYCTPVVAGYKIFFTGNNGFYGNTSQTMYAFDLYSGELLWSHPINPTNVSSHRAFACPAWWTAPDTTEYVAVGGDQVYCYDANTGVEQWKFDAMINGTTNADWISSQMQEFDGMLLARARQNRLYVLDFLSGDLISEVVLSNGSEGGCGAKDGLVYVSSHNYVDCADILSGVIQWSTFLPYNATISHWINPSIVEDRLYISTYKGYVFAIAIDGNADYKPGEIIWDWHDPDIPLDSYPLVGGTAVIGDKIYVAAAFSGNRVYCIKDLGNSGITFWKSATTGYFDASPVWSTAPSYPDGVLYCPDMDGYIRAYNATNGAEIWAYSTEGEFRAGVSPVLDALIVTSGTSVSVFKGPG